jgi:hypothetical protein
MRRGRLTRVHDLRVHDVRVRIRQKRMERRLGVHGERCERVVRRLWLAQESCGSGDFIARSLVSYSPCEEWDAFAAGHGQKLVLGNAREAKEVDGFVVCDDDGAGLDSGAVGAGEVVEVRVRDEDVVYGGHVADGQVLGQYGRAVEPGVEEDCAAGTEAEGCSSWRRGVEKDILCGNQKTDQIIL